MSGSARSRAPGGWMEPPGGRAAAYGGSEYGGGGGDVDSQEEEEEEEEPRRPYGAPPVGCTTDLMRLWAARNPGGGAGTPLWVQKLVQVRECVAWRACLRRHGAALARAPRAAPCDSAAPQRQRRARGV
jgi:hypothetical protein